jgi:small ligand-binding sensory domain FIST
MLFRHALFVGIEMQDSLVHREGELLVRNILGLDPAANVLAVAARLRPFQVIRFLLRDAMTATQDLVRLLEVSAELYAQFEPLEALARNR